jgi:hypothetical protein
MDSFIHKVETVSNELLEVYKKYGYTVFTLVVENRHGGKNIHNVPEEIIEKMKQRFEIKL